MKNLPKIFKIFFLTIFVLQLIGFIVLLLAPMASQAATGDGLISAPTPSGEGTPAADKGLPTNTTPATAAPTSNSKDINFKPQVEIPTSDLFKKGTPISLSAHPQLIAEYINAIYKYAIGIVGILATVVMMFGGFMYMMAGGDSGKLSEAKEWIKASITGLIIALSSYMILNTISPSLLTLKMQTPKPIATPGCCYSYKATGSNEVQCDASSKESCPSTRTFSASSCDKITYCATSAATTVATCSSITNPSSCILPSCVWTGSTCTASAGAIAGQSCTTKNGNAGTYSSTIFIDGKSACIAN